MSHARWKTLRERKLAEGHTEPEDVTEARREIRLSMALAQAVYDRRTELGLSRHTHICYSSAGCDAVTRRSRLP